MEDHDEDQEEEQVSTIQNAAGPFKTATSRTLIPLSLSLPAEKKPLAMSSSSARYTECLKNHAASIGGHAVDGCGEFMPAGPKGNLEALTCAACGCHRNFHRKEVVDDPTLRQQQQIRPISCYKPHPVLFRFYPCEEGATSFEKKRVRTKFTAEQKERMRQAAEKVGWRLQKKDEAAVQRFCQETGIKRHVFKVWMHNHKHTFANKLPLA